MSFFRSFPPAVGVVALVSVGFAAGSVPPAVAQAPHKAASGFPACARLISTDELTAAVGDEMAVTGQGARGDGESECSWTLRGPQMKILEVKFFEERFLKTTPSAPTLDALYERILSAVEDSGPTKRVALTGVGERAAVVAGETQSRIVAQRKDGIALITASGLTRDQLTAVAKAVVTP